jgi:hypothetical protein
MNTIEVRYAKTYDTQNLIILLKLLGYPQESNDFKERFKLYNTLEGYGIAVAQVDEVIAGFIA